VLVLDQPVTSQDLAIEIRAPWSPVPPFLHDLERLGLQLTEQSRMLVLETSGMLLTNEQLRVLFDPQTEQLVERGGVVCRDSFAVDGATGLKPSTTVGVDTVDVFCRPGVTDAEGEMAALALTHAGAPGVQCRAGLRYRFTGPVESSLRPAVERLLGNPLIHRFRWHDQPEVSASNEFPPALGPVQSIELRNAGDDELLAVSRRFSLALDRDEMQAIQRHFAILDRRVTDVELQSIALAWSEHCSHKTFKAAIELDCNGQRSTIRGLLAECFVAPTAALNRRHVRSAFVDNAGVIAFDRDRDLAIKVETHNHPSALEPYGGAHTGVGGVIRDILAVSAEPIANTDVLCFGPLDLDAGTLPAGTFHPGRTYRDVVRGIADYGNNMGIPTIGGAVLFHPGYTANPLVFCGTLGIAPRGSHPREPRPGDVVVLLGGHTGRDGLHGATMSSESLDRERHPDGARSSTVQIGAPITEKLLRDVLPQLRDERLYHALTDCGAGGLCSAIGEMGERLGVEVELARVPLKYEGLTPWEIWLSEAQERMVLAVPAASLPRLHELCAAHDVEETELGRFRKDGVLRLTYEGRVVADLGMSFLHGGRPQKTLPARWTDRAPIPYRAGAPGDANAALLALLGHPNIASKESVIRRYDHEVGARTIVKPLTSRGGPSDAAVLQPGPTWRGVAVAHGINPLYGQLDPYAMAFLVIDEALRNLVAVGGAIDRAALLDNFCWGNVDDADELGRLARAAQGCRDAALAYGVPFVSGKDSLRNVSIVAGASHSIPGTLLITAVGPVRDVRQSVTMELKAPGSELYLLGETGDELGGSHYLARLDRASGVPAGTVPRADPKRSRRIMRRVTRAAGSGLVRSCHDLSEGGLAVAAAEMVLAGCIGAEIDIATMPATTEAAEALLFAESAGRFLVEVAPEDTAAFERLFVGLPCARVGTTAAHDRCIVRYRRTSVIDLTVAEISGAFKGSSSGATDTWRPGALDRGGHPQGDAPTANEAAAEHVTRRRLAKKPRAMILAAAGVNCDPETAEACRLAGAETEIVHLNQLLRGERRLGDSGMLVLPGGFSYGDHLGAGAMLAAVLRHRFLDDLRRFIADGRPVLGICNGFQILARLGLLGPVSLVANAAGRFECRWVRLRVTEPVGIFLDGLDELELPVAHGEGRVVVPRENRCGLLGRSPLRYIDNPNGSTDDIAGVCNEAGTVLGLMPHPERYVTPYHHPRHAAARGRGGVPDGLMIFRNAIRHAGSL